MSKAGLQARPSMAFFLANDESVLRSSKSARALVDPAIRLDKICQALSNRLCFPGVPQHRRPLAAGLGIREHRMATLPKVLINCADHQIGEDVALRLRT
jgi:hypothetical protein